MSPVRRVHVHAVLILCAAVGPLVSGCDREVIATIDAAHSGGFASTLGLVDRSGLQLGSLFLVDPSTMTARGIGTYEPVRYEQRHAAKIASRKERITSDLAIEFSPGAEAPAGWETLGRRLLARSGEIEALGYETTSILNVELYLTDRSPLQEAARVAEGRDRGIFYLVTSVGHADSARIEIEGGVRTGRTNRLTTPEGVLVVEAPSLDSDRGIRFVRCTAYRYAPDDEVLQLDPSADLDLSRVDLSHAYVPTR